MSSKSERLRLSQVRAVFDLVHQCCELGADPVAWRGHLVQEMNAVLGAQVSVAGLIEVNQVTSGSSLGSMLEHLSDFGWPNESERAHYLELLDCMRRDRNPFFNPILRELLLRPRPGVRLRRELVSDEEWYGSPFGTSYLRPSRIDDPLVALEPVSASSFILFVAQRAARVGPFDRREAKALNLLRYEVCRMLACGKLASFDSPSLSRLSPRLREVLRCLLEGDSEKQVSLRLGLSRHTVHEHVKRLHRHFDVASRGELFAPAIPTFPPFEPDRGGKGTGGKRRGEKETESRGGVRLL